MKGFVDSIKGVAIGFVFVLICIAVLGWNEWNNVRNIKALEEARKVFIQVDSTAIEPDNDGKLVATNGMLNVIDDEITDSLFDVSVKSAKLLRTVEMYQWEEEVHEDDKGYKTYSYKNIWSEELINSSQYNDKSYSNPTSMTYESQTIIASDVKLGAFNLSENQKEMLSTNEKVNIFDLSGMDGYTQSGDYITNSSNLSSPQIGDVRISYTYNNSKEISLLACQYGDTFTDYLTKSGVKLNKVVDGLKPGKEIISIIQDENNFLKWMIRLFGTLFMMLGFAVIFKPLAVIGAHIPILGRLVGAALGLVSILLGLGISLTVIAIAWFTVRPILSIGLLAAVLVILVILAKTKKNAFLAENSN